MVNFTKVSNELAKKFIRAKDKKYALNKIIYDINHLIYSDNGEPLGYKAKSVIFKHIFDVVAGRERLQLKAGEKLSAEFTDIILFFERRDFILKHLRNGVKQQSQLN